MYDIYSNMKILFINPVSGYIRGGGEINDLNLAKAMRDLGHEVIHIDIKDNKKPQIEYPDNTPVVSIEMPFYYDRALKIPNIAGMGARAVFFYHFLRKLKKQQLDLLQSADIILLTGKPILAKIKAWTDASLFLSVRGRNHSYMYPKYKMADSVIYWGGCDNDHPAHILRTTPHLALNPAIEHSIFKPGRAKSTLRRELALGVKDAVRLLYVGRLDPVHQVDMIIRSVAAAHKAGHRNLVLNIVGNGAQKAELETLAASITPNIVKFWGLLDREEIADMHRASDIFIINPNHTNHPIALKEAIACKTCALAPKLGRVEAILKGYSAGHMFTPNDQTDLNKTLISLLENPAQIKKAKVSTVSKDTWQSNAEAILKQYAQVHKKTDAVKHFKIGLMATRDLTVRNMEHIFYRIPEILSKKHHVDLVGVHHASDRINQALNIYKPHTASNGLWMGPILSRIKELKDYCKTENPDILMAISSIGVNGLAVAVTAKLHGKKSIVRLTSDVFEVYKTKQTFMGKLGLFIKNNILGRIAIFLADQTVLLHDAQIPGLLHAGFRKGRFYVVPQPLTFPSLPASAKDKIRKSLQLKKSDALIGSMMRLDGNKNINLLIDVMIKGLEKSPKLHFVVIGKGDMRENLIAMFKDRDRIHFIDQMPRDDLAAYYQACDAVLHLSDSEGLSNVIIEALYFETPVIATDSGPITRSIVSNIANNADDIVQMLIDKKYKADAPPKSLAANQNEKDWLSLIDLVGTPR